MTRHTLEYGQTLLEYDLTFHERATLAIRVHPNTQVTVEAPLNSDLSEIEKRIRKRAAWILRQQRDFRRFSLDFPPRQYVSGETHRFLGQQYRLKVVQSDDGKDSIRIDREQILVLVGDREDRRRVRNRVVAWYRGQASAIFTERIAAWYPHFERFGIPLPQANVRQMRSRWGSCTEQGKITLNLKLVMVPRQLIDYVVVHELCHLVEHNHSSGFYDLLSRIMPGWEERKKKLEGYDFG